MMKILTQFLSCVFKGSVLLLLLGNTSQAQERERLDTATNLLDTIQDQTVHLLYESKPKKYITGAVSSIAGSELSNVPGTNRLNSLAGRLPGLTVNQRDGLPGYENNALQIRGSNSFVTSGRPLILINGRIDDPSMIEPNDIESISVLKDAATTVLQGLQSSSGVLLITTKRGAAGKLKVNYNMETSFQQPTRSPKFLDAYNYALLFNEAQLNDNPAAIPRYDAAGLEAYKTGSNPYLYPNINWSDELIRDFSMQIRNNLNISAGTQTARYYFSVSHLNESGIFNVDKDINTYNTNSGLNLFNVRAGIDLDINKNLSLATDVRAKRQIHNAPGGYSSAYDESILGAIYGTPANAYPKVNADGSLGGNLTYDNNPYGTLNYSGYNNYTVASLSTFSELTYDFQDLIKGLKLKANFGFSNWTEHQLSRSKSFAVYELNTGTDPHSYIQRGTDGTMGSSQGYLVRQRVYDHSLGADYAIEFGEHNFTSFLMYQRQQLDDAQSTNLTRNFQGPKGKVSYRFKNRYLVDFAAAYTGSEQYPKGDRYGFFPAVSAAWIVSEESFLKTNALDYLKVRGSYGKTGLQAGAIYFDYLNSYSQAANTGGTFGTTPATSIGIYQNSIDNQAVTWEKSLISNMGLDIALLNNRFNASFDYFTQKTSDILIANATSAMYGASILSPTGSLAVKGYEVQAGWANRIKEFQYSISANYSLAKDKITNMEEQSREYAHMYQTGNPYGARMGYVFDRFFTENDDLSNLPDQSLLGIQQAGDLKYKDLNGDNIIDDRDITVIGNPVNPQAHFGANLAFKYKGIDMNVFFHGTNGGTAYNSGSTYYEFANAGRGNVMEHHLNRWTPGSGQAAGYPRLTLANSNNFIQSSYWVQDNSFVRLKYAELGFTLPVSLVKKIGLSSTRIFVNGYNLFLWDTVEFKDLEADALSYPLQRSFSIGLNAKF